MSGKIRFTPEEKEQAVIDYLDRNKSGAQICEELCISSRIIQDWATDVTKFKVPGETKKLYQSAILDLNDRYPVAYVISSRNDNRLVFKTFDQAIAASPDTKPIFHSDRGFQYTSKVFKKKLEKQEMEQSMSRVGAVSIMDRQPLFTW